MPSLRRLTVSLLACLAVAPAVQAWGPAGHSIVAELAQQHLSPAAEREVERLLAPEHTNSLADISSWPDQIRNDPTQQTLWKQTSKLHYIDFESGDCNYVPPRDCANGQCVVDALTHYVAVLGDRSQPDAARREALKFVVHFVGDEHQPLHANYQQDKGGNEYQVHIDSGVQIDGNGMQLHRVWDSGLLNTRGLDWKAYAQTLDAAGPVSLPPERAPLDNPYAQWAEESCEITHAIYPKGHPIDRAYVDAERPVAELRLREAGRRLAEVLNATLGH